MRIRIFVGLIVSVLASSALAAQGGPVYTAVPTVPVAGGACYVGRVQIEAATGIQWCCPSGTWAACGSAVNAAGTSTVPLTAPSYTVTTPSAEELATTLLSIQPFTAGIGAFQLVHRSFPNPAPQQATYNNGFWMGWNAGRHAPGAYVVNGQPAMIMGFEDNYFDAGGVNEFGMEWYVEYWSPDGTSVQMLRPFYARVGRGDNAANHAYISHNIGTDGTGQFAVKTGIGPGTNALLYIDPNTTIVYTPFTSATTAEVTDGAHASAYFNGGVWIGKKLRTGGDMISGASVKASGAIAYDTSLDRMAAGIMSALPVSSVGTYVGWSGGGFGNSLAGDLLLVPRTSIGGVTRFYAGSGTPAEVMHIGPAAVGFNSGVVLTYDGKCDSTTTPGAATCNQAAGRAAIAAGATSVVITDSLVTATSIVLVTPQSLDATCLYPRAAAPTAGSFTFTMGPAACTGNVNFSWIVSN